MNTNTPTIKPLRPLKMQAPKPPTGVPKTTPAPKPPRIKMVKPIEPDKLKTPKPLKVVSRLRMKSLAGMLALEFAADDWFHSMSPAEKQAYLKAHPGSKMGSDSGADTSRTSPRMDRMHDSLLERGYKHVRTDNDPSGTRHYEHKHGHDVSVDTSGGWAHQGIGPKLWGSGPSSLDRHLDQVHHNY